MSGVVVKTSCGRRIMKKGRQSEIRWQTSSASGKSSKYQGSRARNWWKFWVAFSCHLLLANFAENVEKDKVDAPCRELSTLKRQKTFLIWRNRWKQCYKFHGKNVRLKSFAISLIVMMNSKSFVFSNRYQMKTCCFRRNFCFHFDSNLWEATASEPVQNRSFLSWQRSHFYLLLSLLINFSIYPSLKSVGDAEIKSTRHIKHDPELTEFDLNHVPSSVCFRTDSLASPGALLTKLFRTELMCCPNYVDFLPTDPTLCWDFVFIQWVTQRTQIFARLTSLIYFLFM